MEGEKDVFLKLGEPKRHKENQQTNRLSESRHLEEKLQKEFNDELAAVSRDIEKDLR